MKSENENTASSGFLKLALAARLIMGLLFVLAGAAKSWDPVIFYWEIVSYLDLLSVDQHAWHRLASLAIGLGPVELAVGVGLLLNWRPRWIHPIAVVMMTVFLLVTGYAWSTGANVDCGCFGALAERSPGEAFVEDVVMLVLLLISWRWQSAMWPSPGTRLAGFSTGKTIGAIFVVQLIVVAMLFYPDNDRLVNSDLTEGIELRGVELKGVDVDLGSGSYLVELFSPVCSRCKKAVPKLNRWADSDNLPTVIALNSYPQDSRELKEFQSQMNPRFDIATISKSDWMRLTVGHGWPRLAWIRDGIVQRVWEYNFMPSTSELQRVVSQ